MGKKSHAAGWMPDSPSPAQLAEFFRQCQGPNPRITGARLQSFLRGDGTCDNLAKEWQDFYQRVFGITVDFTRVKVPKHKKGFDRVIYVPQGLTLNQAYQVCQKRFKCWKGYDDLDKAVKDNDRTSEKSYAIRLRDRVEADEELKNLSANQLKEKGIPGITLLERLILELKYYDETGNHLDIQNITLCSGSRDANDDVPYVYWYPGWVGGKLRVHWYWPGWACGNLRGRSVVS